MKYSTTFILSLLFFSVIFAAGDNLVSSVIAKYAKIKSIQGNFVQNSCSENEGTCQQFEGKFIISRPYFSRLEVTKPEKQLIITDSTSLYIYLTNKKKVYIQSAGEGINFFKIFDMFLNDPSKFKTTLEKANYIIMEYKKDTLDQYQPVADLKFWINPKTNLIEQFSFIGINSSENKFELKNINLNPKLSKNLFKFEIPKGVEVIKY